MSVALQVEVDNLREQLKQQAEAIQMLADAMDKLAVRIQQLEPKRK